jgi:hypothetical protein
MTTSTQGNTDQSRPESATKERRNSPRIRVSKPRSIHVKDAHGTLICAVLLDFSRTGLRISYEGAYLKPGSWIGICYEWGEAPARVVWTAIAGARRETGLDLDIGRHATFLNTLCRP